MRLRDVSWLWILVAAGLAGLVGADALFGQAAAVAPQTGQPAAASAEQPPVVPSASVGIQPTEDALPEVMDLEDDVESASVGLPSQRGKNRSVRRAGGSYSIRYPAAGMTTYEVKVPVYGYQAGPPDPELQKLLEEDGKMEQQAQALVAQYCQEKDQQKRAKLKEQLQTLTEKHFDLRQQRRELEITRLEEQLERVRASIKKRTEARDLIIQRRMARLLGEEDDLAF